MTDSRTGHLIKMANEIALNLAVGTDEVQAASRTAEHLRRFWTREMQQQLLSYQDSGGGGLSAVAASAMQQLRAE